MDSIMNDDEDLDGDELFERIENFPLEDEINSLLVLPYVDHTAGLSFQTVAACLWNDDNLLIYERADGFTSLSNSRFGAVKDFEFEYLENLKVKANCDLEDYISRAMETFGHYNDDEKIFELRNLELLDEVREPEYPDDIFVGFFKKGFGGEGMWVRYEDVEGTDFYGVLLNQPNQDLGVNMGDRVKFHLTKDKDDKVFCFCDLDE